MVTGTRDGASLRPDVRAARYGEAVEQVFVRLASASHWQL
jgi:hypothetical protein